MLSIGSSMLFIAEQCSALQVYHSLGLSSHHLVGIWFVTSLVLLQIEVLWTSAYKFLYEHMPSSLFSKYQEVEQMGHQVQVHLTI